MPRLQVVVIGRELTDDSFTSSVKDQSGDSLVAVKIGEDKEASASNQMARSVAVSRRREAGSFGGGCCRVGRTGEVWQVPQPHMRPLQAKECRPRCDLRKRPEAEGVEDDEKGRTSCRGNQYFDRKN